MTKRHAKPTAQALSERTYRHVLAFKRTLLNQMAHIRLDISQARREDRTEIMEELAIIKRRAAEASDAQDHVRILAGHCERLLREKETLQRQLYAVQQLKDDTKLPTFRTPVTKGCAISHLHVPGILCHVCNHIDIVYGDVI